MNTATLAEDLIRGKKKSVQVANLRAGTAIRIAGRRRGAILTVQRVKGGYRIVKSTAKLARRKKSAPARRAK